MLLPSARRPSLVRDGRDAVDIAADDERRTAAGLNSRRRSPGSHGYRVPSASDSRRRNVDLLPHPLAVTSVMFPPTTEPVIELVS